MEEDVLDEFAEEEDVELVPLRGAAGILALETPLEGFDDGLVVDDECWDGGFA